MCPSTGRTAEKHPQGERSALHVWQIVSPLVRRSAPTIMCGVFVLLCVCVQSSQCMWLMQALGFLLSALPEDEVLVRIHALITPHIQQLDTLVQQEVC